MNRRGFIGGLLAAPAIVRIDSLMPIRGIITPAPLTLMWSDIFIASGGVINFNNGDVTITHGSNITRFL